MGSIARFIGNTVIAALLCAPVCQYPADAHAQVHLSNEEAQSNLLIYPLSFDTRISPACFLRDGKYIAVSARRRNGGVSLKALSQKKIRKVIRRLKSRIKIKREKNRTASSTPSTLTSTREQIKRLRELIKAFRLIKETCAAISPDSSSSPNLNPTPSASPGISPTPSESGTPTPDPSPTSTPPSSPSPSLSPSPAPTAPTELVSSITQHEITVNFSPPVPGGQFVNGDWWVVGPVTIASSSPVSQNSRNGIVIDPQFDSEQGYDSRIGDYNASLDRSLPLSLSGDGIQSVIFTKSNPEERPCGNPPYWTGWYNRHGICEPGPIDQAMILTVLNTPPSENSFRPPYINFGNSPKPIFSANGIEDRIEALLPNLSNNFGGPSWEEVTELGEGPYLDHVPGWGGRYIHPIGRMYGYAAGNVLSFGQIGLKLMTSGSVAQKLPGVIGLVQAGIDFFGLIASGGTFPADGGHGSGRKFPIVFAGMMLEEPTLLNIADSTPETAFAEDSQTYYSAENPPFSTSCYPSLANKYNTPSGYAWFGIRHAQDPSNPDYHGESEPCGTSNYSTYFELNVNSWVGQACTMKILGLQSSWAHPSYFDLMQRVAETSGFGGVWGSNWSNQMAQEHCW